MHFAGCGLSYSATNEIRRSLTVAVADGCRVSPSSLRLLCGRGPHTIIGRGMCLPLPTLRRA